MSSRVEKALASLGIVLPNSSAAAGLYESVVIHEGLAFVSGQLPRTDQGLASVGKVGDDLTANQAREAARIAALRALAVLRDMPGSLDAVDRLLRLTVYVNVAPNFTELSDVGDGASDLLYAAFGGAGAHARSVLGVSQLPKGAAVEIELTVAVTPDRRRPKQDAAICHCCASASEI